MSKDGIVRRNPVPMDLRNAGPSGAMETHWQPEAFAWYGNEVKRASGTDPYIRIGKTSITISNQAVIQADFALGDRLQIGINKGFLAIKKDESGLPAAGEPKKTKTLHINAKGLIKKIANEGYPVPCRLSCQWDTRSQMLVGKWPKMDKERQVAP